MESRSGVHGERLHIGVDEATAEIVAAVATTNNLSDDEVLEDLLDQVEEEVEQVTADGAYDKRKCYAAIAERKARAVIPPRRGARLWHQDESTAEQPARNEQIQRISEVGRAQWKARERVLPAELSRDDDVPLEDDLREQAHGTKL